MTVPPERQNKKPVNEEILLKMTWIPIILFFMSGLFTGGFMVTILFRRIALAIVFAGPMLFTLGWMAYDWHNFRNRGYALGAFAISFCVTFLAFDREA